MKHSFLTARFWFSTPFPPIIAVGVILAAVALAASSASEYRPADPQRIREAAAAPCVKTALERKLAGGNVITNADLNLVQAACGNEPIRQRQREALAMSEK